MTIDRRAGIGALLSLLACGCMTYRGPRGVEATIARKQGVELHREIGFALGPISTRIAASFLNDRAGDLDLRDLSRIHVAVFEVVRRTGAAPQPLTAEDLGVEGWSALVEERAGDDQVLVLVKPGDRGIREMMVASIDGDEVVLARLGGRLDRLIDAMLGPGRTRSYGHVPIDWAKHGVWDHGGREVVGDGWK